MVFQVGALTAAAVGFPFLLQGCGVSDGHTAPSQAPPATSPAPLSEHYMGVFVTNPDALVFSLSVPEPVNGTWVQSAPNYPGVGWEVPSSGSATIEFAASENSRHGVIKMIPEDRVFHAHGSFFVKGTPCELTYHLSFGSGFFFFDKTIGVHNVASEITTGGLGWAEFCDDLLTIDPKDRPGGDVVGGDVEFIIRSPPPPRPTQSYFSVSISNHHNLSFSVFVPEPVHGTWVQHVPNLPGPGEGWELPANATIEFSSEVLGRRGVVNTTFDINRCGFNGAFQSSGSMYLTLADGVRCELIYNGYLPPRHGGGGEFCSQHCEVGDWPASCDGNFAVTPTRLADGCDFSIGPPESSTVAVVV